MGSLVPIPDKCSLDKAIEQLHPWAETRLHVHVLEQCGNLKALAQGYTVHFLLSQCGRDRQTFIGNHLVQMYGKCGRVDEALWAFEKIYRPNIFSLNILIVAFVQNGHLSKARDLFNSSNERDAYTWTSMLTAYAQHGYMIAAQQLFGVMPEKDTASWNVMISAYARSGNSTATVDLISSMALEGVTPNKITYMNAFAAFWSHLELKTAARLHVRMLEELERCVKLDVSVGNSLIGMYGRCRSMEGAKNAFDGMRNKDLVSWTSMVTAYARNGYAKEALDMFKLMDLEGIPANFVTFTSAIYACTCTGDTTQGRILHSLACDGRLQGNVAVATALINMYAKCGRAECAARIFHGMPHKNVLSWSSMVAAYGHSGHGNRALETMSSMIAHGETPNAVTFVVTLTACVDVGWLHQGWGYFVSMTRDFGICAGWEHYACMVDLLAKCGRLDDAEELIGSMPFHPDSNAWMAYLAGCTTQIDDAERAVTHSH